MRMETKQITLSRGLPKTGQVVSYDAYDDGAYESGWWLKKGMADNKTRFVVKTLDGDEIVIDLATGLMWARDGQAAGCNNDGTEMWQNAIAYADALDFAGFVDWHIPNAFELYTIQQLDEALDPPHIYSEFTNTFPDYYWSSTTDPLYDTKALTTSFRYSESQSKSKIMTPYRLRCVRDIL